MGGSQKSKRVTWASDEYLCQVRLFLSEESPSQVGLGGQDHLQAKISWASHPSGMASDDNLPPGFEGSQPVNILRNKLSQIPLIKWRCPPRFALNGAWRVVAGEESKEVEVENQREMRVLEAIYPRPSAIPPNPSMVMDTEDSSPYDQHTPLIPITSVDDEEAVADMSDSAAVSVTISSQPQPQPLAAGASPSQSSVTSSPAYAVPGMEVINGIDPDVLAAAHTALSTFVANNDQGNLIDPELLIKILSDPKMIEQLVRNHGSSTSAQIIPPPSMQNLAAGNIQTGPASSAQFRPRPVPSAISLSDTAPMPISRTDSHLAHTSRPVLVAPPAAATPSGVFFPPPSRVASVPNLRHRAPEVVSSPSPSVGGPSNVGSFKKLKLNPSLCPKNLWRGKLKLKRRIKRRCKKGRKMLKFLSKVRIEFNALDPRTAACMEFLAQCNARKAKESNPSCQVQVKRRTDDYPPQITVTFVNGVEEKFDAVATPAQTIRNLILEKGQMLETEQMFREAGEQWPVLIPEKELQQPMPGIKPKKAEEKKQ